MNYRRVLTGEGLKLLLSRNVRRLRHKAGLTAQAAATRGGLGLRLWQKIEAGESNMTLETLAKVCAGLGVHPKELFSEAPEEG